MKNTLFICLFAMFALSGCVDDEEEFATGGNISPELTPENKENAVLNTAVFDQLNLDYPGLEKVKQYGTVSSRNARGLWETWSS